MLLSDAIKAYVQKIIITLENTSKQKEQSSHEVYLHKHPFCSTTVQYTTELTSDLEKFKEKKNLSTLHGCTV